MHICSGDRKSVGFSGEYRLGRDPILLLRNAKAKRWKRRFTRCRSEDRIKPQPDEIQLPPLDELPPLEPLPILAELPESEPEVVEEARPKKRGRKLLFLLVLVGIGVGIAYQQGYLDSLL